MTNSFLLRAVLLGGFLSVSLTAGAATSDVPTTELPPAAQARCQSDPAKCEEIKQRIATHREACKQDPQACKQRRDAARQKMKERCTADPSLSQCKAMKGQHHGKHSKPAPAADTPSNNTPSNNTPSNNAPSNNTPSNSPPADSATDASGSMMQ